jgi:hypothetical protein
METVVDAHRAVHDRDAHHLPDETPRHRVGIAIDLDRTIALHTPEEFTRCLEWREPDRGGGRPVTGVPTATGASSSCG